MKKIVFITALFAFVAGSTFAVSSYYNSDVTSIEKVESDKGNKEKKSKEKKSESEDTQSTANAGKKGCASQGQCCKKDSKANCCKKGSDANSSDEQKKDDN
jgi:uncharacterized protein YxeA